MKTTEHERKAEEGEKTKESMSDRILKSFVNRLLVVIAMASTCVSVRK